MPSQEKRTNKQTVNNGQMSSAACSHIYSDSILCSFICLKIIFI